VIGKTWLHGDLNTAQDINSGGAIQAMAFYGDGSGLTDISAASDVNGEDIQVQDLNISGKVISFDLNIQFVPYINAITDINLGIYGLTSQDLNALALGVEANAHILGTLYAANAVIESDLTVTGDLNVAGTDSNLMYVGAAMYFGDGTGLTGVSASTDWADVNAHLVPYIGADADTNLGIYGLTAQDFNALILGIETSAYVLGTLYAANAIVEADLSVGSDANLTDVESSGKFFGLDSAGDANLVNVGMSGSFYTISGLGDSNFASLEANNFYGSGTALTGIPAYPNKLPWADANVADDITIVTTSDLNVTAGANTGIGIEADVNRICFPSNSCEMSIDYNGTALVLGG
jgi:hypothetical protein